jgi:hypothetical protein
MEPLKGTRDRVQALFDRSADAAELIRNLTS